MFIQYIIHLYIFSPANEKTSWTLLTRSCKKRAFVRMPWEFQLSEKVMILQTSTRSITDPKLQHKL